MQGLQKVVFMRDYANHNVRNLMLKSWTAQLYIEMSYFYSKEVMRENETVNNLIKYLKDDSYRFELKGDSTTKYLVDVENNVELNGITFMITSTIGVDGNKSRCINFISFLPDVVPEHQQDELRYAIIGRVNKILLGQEREKVLKIKNERQQVEDKTLEIINSIYCH